MRRQALGYALTGGAAAVVDIGGFHLLARVLPGVLLPATASFLVAALLNYRLTSRWVFGRDWRSLRQAARFFAFACLGLAINAGVTWLLAPVLPPTLAKTAGVGVAFGANFLMNALWVFGLRSPSDGACVHAPAAPGRTRHWAAGAASGRPRPSARE